ncbi:MAG: hypothetical protein ACRC8G_09070 [Plesiomonas shigelloides]
MSYQDDLDWLARYMHEWPFGIQSYVYVITEDDGSKIWGGNVHYCAKRHQKVGKEDWLARRAELTKRDATVCGGQKYIDATWHERGELPPVGVECEINGAVSQELRKDNLEWTRCVILSHTSFPGGAPIAVAKCDEEASFGWGTAKKFRPIRTERDEAIEAMKAHCQYQGSWETTYMLFAESLYDAGYRAGGFE